MLRSFIIAILCQASQAVPFPGCIGGTLEGCPGTANCSTHFFEQDIDHFNWAPPLGGNVTTYQQRYFVNNESWVEGGPIFFYLGNEDDVELYVNHTGLMWENAAEFKALLVFAEHRYYGKSLPFSGGTAGCMSWLTTEQALADFAYLIDDLQTTFGRGKRLPVIGFGGSYGGMMAAWMRVKYPQAVDGVVAASAPIWSFDDMTPAYNFNSFNIGVTHDASSAGGASDRCKNNLKAAWPQILAAGDTEEGSATLSRSFRTCSPIRPTTNETNDAGRILSWAQRPWGNMAMGNYPYASSYLMHGKSLLPPWPVRVACSHLDAEFQDTESLFNAVRQAVATQFNNTGDKTCYNLYESFAEMSTMRSSPGQRQRLSAHHAVDAPQTNTQCKGSWDYQYCTEMTQPFTQGTAEDMFYCSPGANCSHWNFEGVAASCVRDWGVKPRKQWANIGLSSKHLSGTTNIVFSNGLMDPWHGGGVLQNISDTVIAVLIPNGGHHIDLMFSDPADAAYPDILHARAVETTEMRRWVAEANAKNGARGQQAFANQMHVYTI